MQEHAGCTETTNIPENLPTLGEGGGVRFSRRFLLAIVFAIPILKGCGYSLSLAILPFE